MKQVFYFSDHNAAYIVGGSDPIPTSYRFPDEFILAVCRGESACYSGTMRALRLFLNNPQIHRILSINSDRKAADYPVRLAAISLVLSNPEV